MLEQLKKEVFEANIALGKSGLVKFTWGNVSGIDREKELFVIKPSGVSYEELSPDKMVVVDLTCKKIEGDFKPSSDTATHAVLYRHFKNIGGVTHTHSINAASFAQAGLGIPALGTTHADFFYGEVPVTRKMTEEEIGGFYELETGNVIIERFKSLNYEQMRAVLVYSHGPFTWGKNAMDSVETSIVLEECAELCAKTFLLNNGTEPMQQALLHKHFSRKHGKNAYYGQN